MLIPFGIASLFMILWGRRADKSGERVWNTSLPLALTSLCLAATLVTSSLTLTMILLSLILIGNYAVKGPFWALADRLALREHGRRWHRRDQYLVAHWHVGSDGSARHYQGFHRQLPDGTSPADATHCDRKHRGSCHQSGAAAISGRP